jgi:hypothetical protein
MQQGIGKRRALIFRGELRSFLSVLGSSAFDNPTGIGSLGCPSIGAFAGGALFSDRESPHSIREDAFSGQRVPYISGGPAGDGGGM